MFVFFSSAQSQVVHSLQIKNEVSACSDIYYHELPLTCFPFFLELVSLLIWFFQFSTDYYCVLACFLLYCYFLNRWNGHSPLQLLILYVACGIFKDCIDIHHPELSNDYESRGIGCELINL
jgi:hypothetical protein